MAALPPPLSLPFPPPPSAAPPRPDLLRGRGRLGALDRLVLGGGGAPLQPHRRAGRPCPHTGPRRTAPFCHAARPLPVLVCETAPFLLCFRCLFLSKTAPFLPASSHWSPSLHSQPAAALSSLNRPNRSVPLQCAAVPASARGQRTGANVRADSTERADRADLELNHDMERIGRTEGERTRGRQQVHSALRMTAC